MPRVYVVDIAPAAITVAADIIEISPADDKPIRILGICDLLQTTDVGDAMEEIIGVFWIRGHTSSGSGGSAPTPEPLEPNDAAAGFTAETLNTTAASGGTTKQLPRHGWNIRQPMTVFYPPECCPKANQGNTTLVLRMAAAPADSITISGSIIVEEL